MPPRVLRCCVLAAPGVSADSPPGPRRPVAAAPPSSIRAPSPPGSQSCLSAPARAAGRRRAAAMFVLNRGELGHWRSSACSDGADGFAANERCSARRGPSIAREERTPRAWAGENGGRWGVRIRRTEGACGGPEGHVEAPSGGAGRDTHAAPEIAGPSHPYCAHSARFTQRPSHISHRMVAKYYIPSPQC